MEPSPFSLSALFGIFRQLDDLIVDDDAAAEKEEDDEVTTLTSEELEESTQVRMRATLTRAQYQLSRYPYRMQYSDAHVH